MTKFHPKVAGYVSDSVIFGEENPPSKISQKGIKRTVRVTEINTEESAPNARLVSFFKHPPSLFSRFGPFLGIEKNRKMSQK